MATSYINTGVLGQVLGGSLATGQSIGQQYQQFAEGVQRKKRRLSGPSRAERQATAERRQERLAAAEQDVGVRVDTADVSVPTIRQERTKSLAAQVKQRIAEGQPEDKTGITQVQTPSAPSPEVISPEKQYTAEDEAFVRAFDAYYQNISTKNATDVRSGAITLQSQYAAALSAAEATGRQEFISAIQGAGAGVAGSSHISAKNVGQAKAGSQAARTSIRGLIDLDTILKTPPASLAPVAPIAATTATQTSRVSPRQRLSTNPFRRGY